MMIVCRNLSLQRIYVGLPLSFSTNVICIYLKTPSITKNEVTYKYSVWNLLIVSAEVVNKIYATTIIPDISAIAELINSKLYPSIFFLVFVPLIANSTSSLLFANAKNNANRKVIIIIHMDKSSFIEKLPAKSLRTNPVAIIEMSIIVICFNF